MSTLTITTRKTKAGHRYHVRFRIGGRLYPLVHAGSFTTLKEARMRRDFVAGELAAGRNPADALRALLVPPAPRMTVSAWTERYLDSRIDVGANTLRNYKVARKKVGDTFGDRDPESITVADVTGWVSELAEKHKPGTIGLYVLTFRMLLDYVGTEPNPLRDPRVRLPKQTREEPKPPSAEHFTAIIETMGKKRRLLFLTVEQGALRIGEAVQLRWQDVDAAGLRLRLPKSATKTGQSRWVYLPEWCIDAIEATCPLEDRVPERRVFTGIADASAYQAMTRACALAKVPRYSPHDLRTAASRCGISRVCRPGSSPSEQVTRGRRCRSTCTAT